MKSIRPFFDFESFSACPSGKVWKSSFFLKFQEIFLYLIQAVVLAIVYQVAKLFTVIFFNVQLQFFFWSNGNDIRVFLSLLLLLLFLLLQFQFFFSFFFYLLNQLGKGSWKKFGCFIILPLLHIVFQSTPVFLYQLPIFFFFIFFPVPLFFLFFVFWCALFG